MVHPMQLAREQRGWSQSELARRAAVSRQLVGSVESGVHAPRVDAAIALARALDRSVEQLFTPAASESKSSPVVLPGTNPSHDDDLRSGQLLVATQVGSRTIVTPVGGPGPWLPAADAIATDTGVTWLPGARRDAALVAGCDPCLGMVADMLAQRSGQRMTVTHASTARSARWLREGLVHAAVVHGRVGELPTWRRGAGPQLDRYLLTGWQVGIAGPAGPPPDVEQICEQSLPVVQRESGAGSQAAFVEALHAAGADAAPAGPVAASHLDATARVMDGAPAAVTMHPAALAAGLSFTPLADHTVELWIDHAHADHPAVLALLELLNDPAMHRRLNAVGGYETKATGTRVADSRRRIAS